MLASSDKGVSSFGGNHPIRHDFGNFLAMRFGVIEGKRVRWRNCLDPPRPTFQGAVLFTMQQIGFAENAEDIAIGIDDGQSANVVIGKQPHRRRDLVIRPDCDDVPDHHIAAFIFLSSAKSVKSAAKYAAQL